MPAPLSIVIPTLNAADRIGPTLAALSSGVMSGLVRELVISDGGSSDAISDIAEATGARFVSGPASRGAQLRRGVEATKGEWLLILHADTRPPEGWERLVADQIEAARARGGREAAVFRLAFDDASAPARLVAGWANLRTRLFALPYGDQGLLVSRRLYEAAGGYPDAPLMEDVALIRAIGRRRFARLPGVAVTSAEKYRREGWMRRGWRNWRCLALYFCGVAPEKIVERYQ